MTAFLEVLVQNAPILRTHTSIDTGIMVYIWFDSVTGAVNLYGRRDTLFEIQVFLKSLYNV